MEAFGYGRRRAAAGRLHRNDIDRLTRLLPARRAEHARDRGDILVVTADRDGDVVLTGEGGIGRVVADPAGFVAAPGAHPRVHRIGAGEARLAGRGNGAEEAADVAGGDADAAETRDHHIREILADAAAHFEGLLRQRIDIGRLAVEAEVGFDPFAQTADDLADRCRS